MVGVLRAPLSLLPPPEAAQGRVFAPFRRVGNPFPQQGGELEAVPAGDVFYYAGLGGTRRSARSLPGNPGVFQTAFVNIGIKNL